MKNVIVRSTLFAGVLGALVLGTALPAAADEASDAVASIQAGESYVAPGINADVSNFNGSNVAVAVMDVNGNSTQTPAQIAGQIQGQLGGNYTVIVVNTDTSSGQAYGVAPSTSSASVLPILGDGSSLSASGRVDNLNSKQADIITATETIASTETDTNTGDGFNAGPVLGFGGGLLGAVLIASLAFTLVRKSKNKVRAVTTRVIKNSEMEDAMEELGRLTEKHANQKHNTSKVMASILTHLNELFSRLDRKGVENQKALAAVEYGSTIKKLNNALGNDYYLDIANNGNLWDRGDERLREVEAAARAVDEQILLNIRQVNSSKDLDFRVALEGMLRSVDQPNASDMIRKPGRTQRR